MSSLAMALLDLGGLVITGYLCDLTSQAPHTLACVPSHYRWRISWAPGPISAQLLTTPLQLLPDQQRSPHLP